MKFIDLGSDYDHPLSKHIDTSKISCDATVAEVDPSPCIQSHLMRMAEALRDGPQILVRDLVFDLEEGNNTWNF